jgi:hypothetical protein
MTTRATIHVRISQDRGGAGWARPPPGEPLRTGGPIGHCGQARSHPDSPTSVGPRVLSPRGSSRPKSLRPPTCPPPHSAHALVSSPSAPSSRHPRQHGHLTRRRRRRFNAYDAGAVRLRSRPQSSTIHVEAGCPQRVPQFCHALPLRPSSRSGSQLRASTASRQGAPRHCRTCRPSRPHIPSCPFHRRPVEARGFPGVAENTTTAPVPSAPGFMIVSDRSPTAPSRELQA